MKNYYEDVRLWQVHFESRLYLPSLPFPKVVVEEEQKFPSYVIDGRKRQHEPGGQFVITLKGRGAIRIGDRNFSLTPGKAFLHNHNDPTICYYYPPDGKEPWRFLWMAMGDKNAYQLIEALVHRFGNLYDVPLDGELVKKLFSFQCEKRQIRFLSPWEGAGLIISALQLLCSPSMGMPQKSVSLLSSQVQERLAVDYRMPLNMTAIAHDLGVSREHLSRTFRKETGMTFYSCLTRIRMRVAENLLQHTHLSIKEIALQCGFENYSVFYRNFRHFYGQSPENYRQHYFSTK